ncbi:MAG TPA: NAD(P)H-binding protein, partial [Marinobacter sp.]
MAKLAVLITVVMLSGCISVEQPAAPPPGAVSVTKKDVTVALLGATGTAGGFILDRALARTPQKLEAYKDRITIVEGDARDPVALNTLLQGSDVVVSALGPVKADGAGAQMLSTAVTGDIIRLLPRWHIDRYIVVSGAAVVMPGDDRNLTGWLMRQMVLLTLRDTLRDK